MAADKTLQDLFLNTLKDVYLTALPKMAKGGATGRPQGCIREARRGDRAAGGTARKGLQVDGENS